MELFWLLEGYGKINPKLFRTGYIYMIHKYIIYIYDTKHICIAVLHLFFWIMSRKTKVAKSILLTTLGEREREVRAEDVF